MQRQPLFNIMITLKQLQYIVAVTDNGFNISVTAEKLFTSQPGISKQIKLLEEQLGSDVFVRSGKALQGLTEQGEKIVQQARIIITEHDNLIRLTQHHPQQESFSIATTSTQSNYVLPPVLKQFHSEYPKLKLTLQDGNLDQLISIANNREADCIILSGINDRLQRSWFPEMVMIPCYEWHQSLVCLRDNPLAKQGNVSIDDIAGNPIITYPFSHRYGSTVEVLLSENDLRADIFATSNDPNTIKKYAASGMGVGIIAPMAYDAQIDTTLAHISLEKLFPKCTTIIAIERHNILKPHVYRFIKLFAPHLTNDDIEKATRSSHDIQPDVMDLPYHVMDWVI